MTPEEQAPVRQSLVDATRYVLAHFAGTDGECDECAFLNGEELCGVHAVLSDLRTAYMREIGLSNA